MARHDGNPDADTVALTHLIHELRKHVSIEELFAASGEADDLIKTAERLGLSGLDNALVTKLQALVGDADVDLDEPLSGDDSDISQIR